MPETLYKAYRFFQDAVAAFPFWKDEMKPHLERVFGRYVGSHATIDLKPDTQAIEEWLAQKLAISLATDPESVTAPLRNMGDGWQSIIRLAALEALSEYSELAKERVVLLLEEPETHLHPHLCRKIRKVLSELAQKGWTVVYATHSSELVSFAENQVITRLVRLRGSVTKKSVCTETIEGSAKLQSKLDERGAHDFLFGTCAIFCEGKDDTFAVRFAFDRYGIDYDARSASVTQCGSVTAIPAFASIASALGIRWCALTDQDIQDDGTGNPNTQKSRQRIEKHRSESDLQVQWPKTLEKCLEISTGKATAETTITKLSDENWRTEYPDFRSTVDQIARWIDPQIKI
jgi:predicted ATP-dependent endonuclease of OLD family